MARIKAIQDRRLALDLYLRFSSVEETIAEMRNMLSTNDSRLWVDAYNHLIKVEQFCPALESSLSTLKTLTREEEEEDARNRFIRG